MEEYYQETFKTWNRIAQQYEDSFMDFELYNDTYEVFCETIPRKNANLLEIGCGPGNITKYLTTRNPSFRIHAIDVSEKMIALAKKNNPNTDFQVMDCRNINALKKTFDAVICGFTIPYVSKSDCSKLFYDCGNLLEENGIFYVSFVVGLYEDSGYITGSSDNRVYFYYHDLDHIKNELENNSFETINVLDAEYKKSDGTMEVHTIIIARKKAKPRVYK